MVEGRISGDLTFFVNCIPLAIFNIDFPHWKTCKFITNLHIDFFLSGGISGHIYK